MENISSNSSALAQPAFSEKTDVISWCSAFAAVSVFITAGNILTIALFSLKKKLRRKSFFLVMNMALADLMLGALCLPLFIYRLGGELYLWGRKWNFTLEIFLRVVDTLFSQASILSATFISCERLYATCWPFSHRRLTRKAYYLLVLMLWIISVIVSSALLGAMNASMEVSVYIWVAYAGTLSAIICGCYVGVWMRFKRGRHLLNHKSKASREAKSTKTLFLIGFIALLSWLPLIVVNSISLYTQVPRDLHLFVILLNFCNSFANPILYSLRIPEFRKALVACLPCLRKVRPKKSSVLKLVSTSTIVHLQVALRKNLEKQHCNEESL